MSNSNFYIVGKHPVIEALKNPSRKVIKLFLTAVRKSLITFLLGFFSASITGCFPTI